MTEVFRGVNLNDSDEDNYSASLHDGHYSQKSADLAKKGLSVPNGRTSAYGKHQADLRQRDQSSEGRGNSDTESIEHSNTQSVLQKHSYRDVSDYLKKHDDKKSHRKSRTSASHHKRDGSNLSDLEYLVEEHENNYKDKNTQSALQKHSYRDVSGYLKKHDDKKSHRKSRASASHHKRDGSNLSDPEYLVEDHENNYKNAQSALQKHSYRDVSGYLKTHDDKKSHRKSRASASHHKRDGSNLSDPEYLVEDHDNGVEDEFMNTKSRHGKHSHRRRDKEHYDKNEMLSRSLHKSSRDHQAFATEKYRDSSSHFSSSKTKTRFVSDSDVSESEDSLTGNEFENVNRMQLSKGAKYGTKADRNSNFAAPHGKGKFQLDDEVLRELIKCFYNFSEQHGIPIGSNSIVNHNLLEANSRASKTLNPTRSTAYDFSTLLQNLPEIDWNDEELPEVIKPKYENPPSLCDLTTKDIQKARMINGISITIEGKNDDSLPPPIPSFDIGIFPSYIQKYASDQKYTMPTPIQMQAWPILLSGYDVLGIAETGSGKTLSFLFPAFVHVMKQPSLRSEDGPICLIVTPTRELAIQVRDIASNLCKLRKGGNEKPIEIVGCFGGQRTSSNWFVKGKAEFVVASPGKLLNLLYKKQISLNRMSFLVIDETDKMLAANFAEQINGILKSCSSNRQTAMFSATWDDTVELMKSRICTNKCVEIVIGREDKNNKLVAKNIKQRFKEVDARENKIPYVVEEIRKVEEGKILIFCNSIKGVEMLREGLKKYQLNLTLNVIHRDLEQFERNQVMEHFRKDKKSILIATDLLARGIDIRGIALVINFDFPHDFDTYIHRIGRCGRAGRKGNSFTLLNPMESQKFRHQIDQLAHLSANADEL